MYPYVLSSCTLSGRYPLQFSKYECFVFKVEIKDEISLHFFLIISCRPCLSVRQAHHSGGKPPLQKEIFFKSQPQSVILYIVKVAELFNERKKKKKIKICQPFPLTRFPWYRAHIIHSDVWPWRNLQSSWTDTKSVQFC